MQRRLTSVGRAVAPSGAGLRLAGAAGVMLVFGPILPVTASAQGLAGGSIAIRDVMVVDAEAARAYRATVLIDGGRIALVDTTGSRQVRGDEEIDGRGRFLAPGLIEMHVHTSKTRASALGLYVANGITTIRDMGGDHEELLRWRREIRRGDRVGPRMLIAGPYLESRQNVDRMRSTPPDEMVEPVERTRVPIATVSDADRVVDSLARLEVDFLKVRTASSSEVFAALNAAAERNGLKLVGHTMGRSPAEIVDAGHDGVEHLIYPGFDPSVDRATRMAAWRRFAAAGVFVVPTLVAFTEHGFVSRERLEAVVRDSTGALDHRRRYLSRYLVLDWAEQATEADEEREEFFREEWPVQIQYLREMHEAGVTILPGSDVAIVNVFPGFSLADELILLQDSVGMTPAEVLDRATRRAAIALEISDSVGTVAVGQVADLLLLDANPLEDVANVRQLATVFVRGKPFSEADRTALLREIEQAADRRVNDWPRTDYRPKEE